jgi:TatA/E family protein of Tat protein translocase
MLGSLGFPEILFILVLALLVFGPRRLPEVGRKVGRALGEFRRATGDLKRSIDREMTMADIGVNGSAPKSTQPRTAPDDAPQVVPEDPYTSEGEQGDQPADDQSSDVEDNKGDEPADD